MADKTMGSLEKVRLRKAVSKLHPASEGQAKHLNELPTEVLQRIADFVPVETLPALALTCYELHHVAIKSLYRSVHYWGSGYPSVKYRHFALPDQYERNYLVQKPVTSSTRIYDLDKFTHTVMLSENFRSSIKNVHLTWHEHPEEEEERVLAALPWICKTEMPLKSLYLSTPNVSFHRRLNSSLPITHLTVRHGYPTETTTAEALDAFEAIRAWFLIPTMKHIVIDGWFPWDLDPPSTGDQFREKSNVEHMEISTHCVTGKALAHLFHTPKALKSFSYTMNYCMDTAVPITGLTGMDAQDFQDLISLHGDTLRELVISCDDNFAILHNPQYLELDSCSNLVSLQIVSEFLIPDLMGYFGPKHRRSILELHEVLPESLKYLHLETCTRCGDGHGDREDNRMESGSEIMCEIDYIFDRLVILADNKEVSMPNLTYVEISFPPQILSQEPVTDTLVDGPTALRTQERLKAAGIRFKLPLWG